MATKTYHYLITGNSAGGIAAAEAIRERDRENSLAIVSDEPYITYSRPLISEYLAKPCPVETIAFRKPGFYKANTIDTILGNGVVDIDVQKKTVTLANGDKLRWNRLLIATGGTPIVPDMPGINLRGVFTFNKLDDARAIDAFLGRHHRMVKTVVIGGGLIGVSVTEALLRRKSEVVIVEMQDRILSAMLDAEASEIEAEALREAGVTILTGATVTKINSDLSDEVAGVTLADGSVVHGEMVICAIGVRPRLDILKDKGVETNQGIVVNRRMETSIEGIYACGDVAESYDFILGQNRLTPVWPNAYEGGRVAGLNMTGGTEEYAGGTALNAMKYFGKHIVSAGLVNPPADGYEILTSRFGDNYRKIVLNRNKINGLVFAGDIQKSGIVYNLMKDGTNVSAYKQALVAEDFGLASLPMKAWQKRLSSQPSIEDASIIPLPEEPETASVGD